jgi:ribosomal protein L11 methyltransferase
MSAGNADAWVQRFAQDADLHPVITEVPGKPRVRVEIYGELKAPVQRVAKEYGGAVREIKEQNWAALSNEPMPPILVRRKFVVCSARTEAEIAQARKTYAGREVIAVPADMAFGTGHHATTASVLRMLVDAAAQLKGQKWTMADLGCGSGILAIAAVKLGASKVWGCDFDAKAVAVAKENAERNGTPQIRFTKTDVLKWEPKEVYDVVVANIFFDILHAGCPQIVRAVRPGGVLMVSGILKTQAEECLGVIENCGVRWEKVVRKGKWVSAIGQKT